MTFFKCDYRFCRFFRNCPKNLQVSVTLHSNPDEMGMPLYFGRCEEIGRTFTEVSHDRVTITDVPSPVLPDVSVREPEEIKPATDDKKEILDAIKAAQNDIVDAIKPSQSKLVSAINKQNKSIDLLRKEVRGENRSPHEMSAANKKVVKKALEIRAELIKNGTKERNATTDACRKVEELYEIGDYSSFDAFRDAVNTSVKNRELSHGLPEYSIE